MKVLGQLPILIATLHFTVIHSLSDVDLRRNLIRNRVKTQYNRENHGKHLQQGSRVKLVKRKLHGNASLIPSSLSHHSSLSHGGVNLYTDSHQELLRPEHRPFSVHEPVEPKPDVVKRFLSLFTIVSFKNEACASTTSGTNGTCYSSNECLKLGGASSGTCASGFGVCCLFSSTCGGTTSVNGTYFQNPGYSSTYNEVSSCRLTVNKLNDGVCQLRLDFANFVLAQPEGTDSKCRDDLFIVSGGSPVPSICGTNTGAHMYIDMGLSSNSPIVLTTVTSGQSFERSFSVKVTQLECDSLSKAGDGCLQYFTGVSGQMFSFNYNNAEGLQLSNTDYTMCVRMERNFCGIQYTACPDAANTPPQAFSVTGGSPTLGSVVGTSCITDWITIPCATNTSPNVPVYSYSKPFNIYVHTDSLEGSSSPAESSNRGFCINYVQQPCTSGAG